MLTFLLAYGRVAGELARLLDVAFVPGEPAYSGHTGAALARIVQFNNDRDYDHRDWELTKLIVLMRDLQLVERRRPDLFPSFRRKLQDPDIHGYFGSRHELSIAVALLERDVEFEFELPRTADFWVSGDAGDAGIECTSSHLSRDSSRDLTYKVRSALHEKASKPYAGMDVALCLDATNLQGRSLRRGKLVFGSDSDTLLREETKTMAFGSLVAMATVINKDLDPTHMRTYSRFDSIGIAAQLAALLERVFPEGNGVEMRDYSFPPTP